MASESPDQEEILHNGRRRKTPDAEKIAAAQKNSLIAVRQLQQTGTQVGEKTDAAQPHPSIFNGKTEGSGHCCRLVQAGGDGGGKIGGQAGVGVKKQEDVAAGRRGAKIELRPAALMADFHPESLLFCQDYGLIGAAAIDNDYFPDLADEFTPERNMALFIEGGDNDRDSGGRRGCRCHGVV